MISRAANTSRTRGGRWLAALPSTPLEMLAYVFLLLVAAAVPAASNDAVGGGPLLPCGTSTEKSFDQLQSAFVFVHGVCCTQLGERCGPGGAIGLPTTCASAVCARAVALMNASCAALLVSPSFPAGIGFQPMLDDANDACTHAADAAGRVDEPVREQSSATSRCVPHRLPTRRTLSIF